MANIMSNDREWDLSPMVKGKSPQEVKELLHKTAQEFEEAVEGYAGELGDYSDKQLADAIRDLEELVLESSDLRNYCSMRYRANTKDKDSGMLYNVSQNVGSRIESARTVFEIRLGKVLDETPELLESKELANYRHYLEKLKRRAPYRLSETEEELVSMKDVNGIQTLQQLQQSWVSGKTFEIEVGGETKTVTLPELSSMRMSPDREIRKMATKKLYNSYADDDMIHGMALRAICADHMKMTERRGMPSPMTQSLLDQDVDRSTIDTLLNTIEETAESFQDFLQLKAKAMDVKKLPGHDVIAPWVTDPVWTFDWPEAKSIVIDAFDSFDDDLGSVVQSMFDDRRIDSENRVGKMNTAFCSSWPSASKSFVFLNYSKTLNDIYTLAHENGHAAQGHLVYENQTPVNYSMSMCMAETGSIFGELLLTEKILSMADADKERYEILSHVLNSYYYTVYYVGVRAFFEKSLYDAINNGEVIDADLACELWNKAKNRIFGDVVDWTQYMEYEWARIPHFFFSNYRYYNYPYSFAQMLVFAVYGDYQKGEPDFNSRFKQLLAAGGSKSPKEQIADFGYDLTKPKFWKLGSSQADRLLQSFEEII
ncbi:MAG: hypothetical protein GF309_05235 [Candidatus Lokiarchaeota archaeon]|nr:hypothetical protein [Candidatus Lokiarchaeota archaeon]